jgi:hypothetical protein
MTNNKYLWQIFLAILMLLSVSSDAQRGLKPFDEKVIQEIMERWIENTEATIDYTDLQDQLEYLAKNKLDLNTADKEDFQVLFFLTENQVNAIIRHRQLYGDFFTLYELQTIPSLDDKTIYYLCYFVEVKTSLQTDRTGWRDIVKKGKNEVLLLHDNDFQQRAGYVSTLKEQGKSYYLGSPYRYLVRYRFGYGNKVSLGYTGEKDMGEQFFKGAQRNGFDFNSAHMMMRDVGKFKAIVLGDYQANFGQGLTFGSGIAARKSAFVLNTRRNFQAIRPYRSVNENEFLRGAAVTYQMMPKLLFTTFGSYKYISTNYRDSDTLPADALFFTSIQTSGLHRTDNEVLNRLNVLQRIAGAHIDWKTSKSDLGITYVYGDYSADFQKGTAPYQLYNFSGNKLHNFGVDYNFYLSVFNFFGEVSSTGQGHLATTNAVMFPLSAKLDMVLLHRHFSKQFNSIYNNPFSENADGRNENGLYTGLNIRFNRFWTLLTYVDIYQSDWLRYQTDAPSKGNDVLAELQYAPSKTIQAYVRYRREDKLKNDLNSISPADFLSWQSREQFRLNLTYKVSTYFTLRTRLEYVQFSTTSQGIKQGNLVFQDFIYTTPFKELALSARVNFFTVDDFNARIYANEQDVLYQYSVLLFQNSGVRYYLLAHFRISRSIDGWVKYGQTTYRNKEVISSGLEQINGNTVSDMRVQIRFTF